MRNKVVLKNALGMGICVVSMATHSGFEDEYVPAKLLISKFTVTYPRLQYQIKDYT